MTDEELILMAKYPNPNETWQKAFKIYNEAHSENKVGLSCRGCYPKVIEWHLRIRLNK